ncbi:MAG: PAS domain S-box protein, partial [Vicingaceae bacterium]
LEVVNQNQDDLIIEKSDELVIINKELDSEIIARERLEVVNQNQDDLIIKKSDALVSKNNELDKQIIAREKVEQKNKILAEVIEKSGSHILITNEKAIIEYVNPEMLAFLDYTLEELCGKKPSILKPKKYPSFIYKQMWKTLLSGNVYRGDFVNVKKNGERYSSQNIVVPFFNNKKITHYAFIGEDVTTQRENERM